MKKHARQPMTPNVGKMVRYVGYMYKNSRSLERQITERMYEYPILYMTQYNGAHMQAIENGGIDCGRANLENGKQQFRVKPLRREHLAFLIENIVSLHWNLYGNETIWE